MDYKSNSNKSKQEQKQSEKRVEKIISGSAKAKKKSEVKKLTDVFISEDAHNVKSYVIMDVLIPAIKKAIFDIVTNGIDMMLYGETGHSKKKSPASRVSYRSYYEDRDDNRRRDYGSIRRSNYDYNDIVLENRGDAEEVLIKLDELIDVYGSASIADLYDMVGMSGSYTDNRYGWDKPGVGSVVRVGDGWLLKLPKVIILN